MLDLPWHVGSCGLAEIIIEGLLIIIC